MAIPYPTSLPRPDEPPVISPHERRLVHDDGNSGRRFFRKFSLEYIAREQVLITMTQGQAAVFRNWWEVDLVRGGAWFTANWPSMHSSYGVLRRRFVRPPQWTNLGGGAWRVSCDLWIGDAPPMSCGEEAIEKLYCPFSSDINDTHGGSYAGSGAFSVGGGLLQMTSGTDQIFATWTTNPSVGAAIEENKPFYVSADVAFTQELQIGSTELVSAHWDSGVLTNRYILVSGQRTGIGSSQVDLRYRTESSGPSGTHITYVTYGSIKNLKICYNGAGILSFFLDESRVFQTEFVPLPSSSQISFTVLRGNSIDSYSWTTDNVKLAFGA